MNSGNFNGFASHKLFDGLAIAALAILTALVLATFREYGIGWDGPFHAENGDWILRFLFSGGEDRTIFETKYHRFYGGAFDAPVELLARFAPLAPHETRNLAAALTGILAIAGAWRLACYLGGPLVGFLTVVFLASLPSFYGHMFINPKDIPFAAGYVWTLYFMLRAAEFLPDIPFRRALPLGLSLGLTLGIRVGGIILIAYMGGLLLAHFAWLRDRSPTSRSSLSPLAPYVNALIIPMLAVLVPAYCLMISMWPLALLNPILGPLQGLESTLQHAWKGGVLFRGALVFSQDLPASYLPVYFAVKLPEYMLVMMAAAVPTTVLGVSQALRDGDQRQILGYATLLLGIIFPPSYAAAAKSVHYDAIRHFIFILPPLAILLALEARKIAAWLSHRHSVILAAAGVLLIAGVTSAATTMVRLHPYQYTYYNALVGGMPGAARRYESDYWAISYKEVAAKLTAFADEDATANGITPTPGYYAVNVCGPAASATSFLPNTFRAVAQFEQADFYISFTRLSCDARIDAPVVAEITRLGARIAVAKDLRKGYSISRP